MENLTDVLVRLDDERQVIEARRIQLELLLIERLPQTKRAGARRREPEVVDLLAPLTLNDERRGSPSCPNTAA
jgi:hypothetical protein